MKSGVRKATVEELAIINQNFAKREIKEDEIYVFDVEAATTDTLTAYFSRLGKDMIEAFHANVQARQTNPKAFSVGYLFGHNDEMIPSGTLFKSELQEESIGDGQEKAIHFKPTVFMLRNLNVGGINTDDYIKAYEAGHTEAVSVGFIGSSFICDICNNDIRDFFKCEHSPGRLYNTAAEGEPPVMKQCTYTVHQGWFRDRNLLELSGVYAPAMPGMQIDGGGQMSVRDAEPGKGYFSVGKGGEAKPTGKAVVSRNIKDFQKDDLLRFNHAGDGVIELIGRVEMTKEEEKKHAEEIVTNLKSEAQKAQAEVAKALEAVGKLQADNKAIQEKLSALVDKHAKLDEDHNRLVKVLASSETDKVGMAEKLDLVTKEVEKLKTENADMQKQIEAHINSLRKDADEWDVRLNGVNHNAEIFKKEIEALTVDELKLKIETLKKQVAEKYPQGRHSASGADGGEPKQERPVHDRPELYKIG